MAAFLNMFRMMGMLSGLMFFLVLGWLIALTFVCQIFFNEKSSGSLLYHNGRVIGSSLIGQHFQTHPYFGGRPSTASNYRRAHDQASLQQVYRLVGVWLSYGITPKPELVTPSVTGTDPHISPEAAYAQVPYIARYRRVSEEEIRRLIDQTIEKPFLGAIGQARVNVLKLNLSLDVLERQKMGVAS